MMQLEVTHVLQGASIDVLETMFFTEAVPSVDDATPQSDALACELQCSGGQNGSFGVVVDRAALQGLCGAFYGEEGDVSSTQEQELLCELTNMLAGSTLSRYAPTHSCALSSPQLRDYDRCAVLPGVKEATNLEERVTHVSLSMDGGHLLLWCSLRIDA